MDAENLMERLLEAEVPFVIDATIVGRVEVTLGHPQSVADSASLRSPAEAFRWLEAAARKHFPNEWDHGFTKTSRRSQRS